MSSKKFEWSVIGAGPAGIAAVGKLIDFGVEPNDILWVDPLFTVGDFGTKWTEVCSNTKVGLFQRFLEASNAFQFNASEHDYELYKVDPELTCCLELMAEPLRWVTAQLRQKVVSVEGFVRRLTMQQRYWRLNLLKEQFDARNVVLALGAEPKTLGLAGVEVLSLEVALKPSVLKMAVSQEDTVAVFGSSHSSILVIRHLLDCGVKKVINFYSSPLCYAVYLDDWIMFDNTGLKGTTAEWARENIDGTLPENLIRVFSSQEHITHYLPECQKVVYGVGFQARSSLQVGEFGQLPYNDKSGVIAPGLFGFGIAFPERAIDRMGIEEYRVGLWKFMDYLQRIIPVWMRYGT